MSTTLEESHKAKVFIVSMERLDSIDYLFICILLNENC